MYGFGDAFDYALCQSCGCLQITAIPPDMGRFYPDSYYSKPSRIKPKGSIGRRFNRLALSACLTLGRLSKTAPLLHFLRSDQLRDIVETAGRLSARVLDVGCGSGMLGKKLVDYGFTHVRGVDPIIDGPVTYGGQEIAAKGDISAARGPFDLIMFHHSLEHMQDQAETLKRAGALLAPNGKILIRIPVVDCAAWDRYGPDWVQLDAPRHFFLHSRKSIRLTAEKCGFRVVSMSDDSTAFQFFGSELYRRQIPLVDLGRDNPPSPASHFSEAELSRFAQMAAEANRTGTGDQIVVILEAA